MYEKSRLTHSNSKAPRYEGLRDYQIEDVKYLIKNPVAGILSEQRTGKTPTVCRALEVMMHQYNRALIVCPASITYYWKSELKKWTGLDSEIINTTDGSKFSLKSKATEAIYIINYEKLRSQKSLNICQALVKWNPQIVILDEAHRVQNRTTATAKAIHQFRKAPVRWAITGTPATDKPWQAWTMFNWLKPEMFPNYYEFLNNYCVQKNTYVVGGRSILQPVAVKKNMELFLMRQMSTFCIQHKRSEVMQWNEEIEVTKIKLPASNKEAEALDSLENWYEYKDIKCVGDLDVIIRMRQICDDMRIITEAKSESTKTKWIKLYLTDNENKSSLIFSSSRKYLTLLSEELGIPVIHGGIDTAMRTKVVADFQAGKIKTLLCQTQACKEGITLDEADCCIFLDVFPPAVDYMQAKDRFITTTPERVKPKELIHVMLQNTIDEACFEAVEHNIEKTEFINSFRIKLEERRNK